MPYSLSPLMNFFHALVLRRGTRHFLGKAGSAFGDGVIVRPAFITISEAVRGVDLIPVEPKIDLEGGMLARSIDANLTRLRIDGLHRFCHFHH